MRRFIGLGLLAFYALGFLPAAHAEEKKSARPAWVDGDVAEKFPEQRYLTAIGTGSSREAANQDAKKQLASTFRAKVTSESSTESQSSLSESTSAKTSGEGSAKTRSSVSVSTSLELRGVEVKNYYFDAKSKEHYALAVMDKLKVKNSYAMELTKLKNKIEAMHEQFQKKPSAGLGRDILEMADQFEQLNREYAVVNNGNGAPAPLSYSELEKIRDGQSDLQSSKAIALEFSGENDASEFQEMLTSCLASKSIGVVAKIEAGKSPEYSVTYNMREKQKFMDVKDWVKVEFSSMAVIKKNNVLVERKRISKEATGRTKEAAFDSVKEELSEAICSQIASVVSR